MSNKQENNSNDESSDSEIDEFNIDVQDVIDDISITNES